MALKIVGSSPIIHPIKNGHPKRVPIFYGIRRIMGLEEGGGSVAAVKNSPVDCFLARGRVPRRQANLCGFVHRDAALLGFRSGGSFEFQREYRSCMDRRTVSLSGMLGIPPECSVERLAAAAAKEPI